VAVVHLDLASFAFGIPAADFVVVFNQEACGSNP
jgi:hypothetical protein